MPTPSMPTLASLLVVQQTLLAQAQSTPEAHHLLLQHSIVTANRVVLLQQSERWRSALKEHKVAWQSLQQYTQALTTTSSSTTKALEPVQHRVHLYYLKSRSLEHLQGKGKGISFALATVEKGIDVLDCAEREASLYVNIELRMKLHRLQQRLQQRMSNATVPKKTNKTNTETKETKEMSHSKVAPPAPTTAATTLKVSPPIETATVETTVATTPAAASTATSTATSTTAATTVATPTPTPSSPPLSAKDLERVLRMGYMYVNTGKLPQAVEIFNKVLQYDTANLGALLGRGSAW
jgi:hypothetical protein